MRTVPPASSKESTQGLNLAWPFSIAQLVTWGSIYYSFTLFVEPLEMTFGLERPVVMGALTFGLIICGLLSPLVGSMVDRGFAKRIMPTGAALGGVILILWSYVENVYALYVLWGFMGIALSATLYEPAFAVLIRKLGPSGQRSIALLTLVSGLASTVFIPFTHLIIDEYGWRNALIVLGCINLAITAPIYWISLHNDDQAVPIAPPVFNGSSNLKAAITSTQFWLFAIGVSITYFCGAGLIFHIIPLLKEQGYSIEMAVYGAACYGPAMLTSRLLLVWMANRINPMLIISVMTLSILGSLIVLSNVSVSLPGVMIFVFGLGLGAGLLTIVKSILVSTYFNINAFGSISGAMTVPVYILRASAPAAFSLIWLQFQSYTMVIWFVSILMIIAFSCFFVGIAMSKSENTVSI